MSANLARLVTDAAARLPERPALKLDDAVLTYAQLDGATAPWPACSSAKGVEPGDRVGVMLPNVPTSRSPTTACCAPAASSCR